MARREVTEIASARSMRDRHIAWLERRGWECPESRAFVAQDWFGFTVDEYLAQARRVSAALGEVASWPVRDIDCACCPAERDDHEVSAEVLPPRSEVQAS